MTDTESAKPVAKKKVKAKAKKTSSEAGAEDAEGSAGSGVDNKAAAGDETPKAKKKAKAKVRKKPKDLGEDADAIIRPSDDDEENDGGSPKARVNRPKRKAKAKGKKLALPEITMDVEKSTEEQRVEQINMQKEAEEKEDEEIGIKKKVALVRPCETMPTLLSNTCVKTESDFIFYRSAGCGTELDWIPEGTVLKILQQDTVRKELCTVRFAGKEGFIRIINPVGKLAIQAAAMKCRTVNLNQNNDGKVARLSTSGEQLLSKYDIMEGHIIEALYLLNMRETEALSSAPVDEVQPFEKLVVLQISDNLKRCRVKIIDSDTVGWVSCVDNKDNPLLGYVVDDTDSMQEYEIGSKMELTAPVKLTSGENMDAPTISAAIKPTSAVTIEEIGTARIADRKIKVYYEEFKLSGWIYSIGVKGETVLRTPGEKHTTGSKVRQFLEAAKGNNVCQMKEMLGKDNKFHLHKPSISNVNVTDARGKTALVYAAGFANVEAVQFLLEMYEIQANTIDDFERTALHYTTKKLPGAPQRETSSRASIAQMLIEKNAEIDPKDGHGATPLMFACFHGDVPTVQKLIELQADVNALTWNKQSSLQMAAIQRHRFVCFELVKKGANPKDLVFMDDSDDEYADETEEEVVPECEVEAPLEKDTESTDINKVIGGPKPKVAKKKAKSKSKAAAKAPAADGEELAVEESGTEKPAAKTKKKAKSKAKGKAKAKAKGKLLAMMADDDCGPMDINHVVETIQTLDQSKMEKFIKERLNDVKSGKITDLQTMRAIITQCDKDDMTGENVDRCREEMNRLDTIDKVGQQLVALCNEGADITAVEAKIEEAKAAGVTEKKPFDTAANYIKLERPKNEIRKKLRQLMNDGKYGEMEKELDACSILSPEDMEDFRELLATAGNKDEAIANMNQAIKDKDVEQLQITIPICKQFSVDTELAEKTLAIEQPKFRAREVLADAIRSKDMAKMVEASELGEKVGLEAHELAIIHRFIKSIQNLSELGVSLAKVDKNDEEKLEEAKLSLTNALTECRKCGVAENELTSADAMRKKYHNMLENLKGSIRVFVRVRPISKKEIDQGDSQVINKIDEMTIGIQDVAEFTFDAVWTPGSQEEVFNDTKDLIQSAIDGFNVTIFAYGQTGAGKTFTMTGSPTQKGVIPRTCGELFRLFEPMKKTFNFTVLLKMMELYNADLKDLIPRPGKVTKEIKVRNDKKGKVIIEGVEDVAVETAEELENAIESGFGARTVAATAMNAESSRSHLVVIITIISHNMESKKTQEGKLLLCDLAGSERIKKSEVTGEAQVEAIEINKSLTALGNTIEALTSGSKNVPYRDHKLTMLMQDALGGDAKTLMFMNCSPANSNIDETTMSLKYAQRAKNITKKKPAAKAKK